MSSLPKQSASKRHLQDSFKTYQQGIVDNAQALCNGLKNRGIKIVSDGTDNHLMLVDLTPFELTGKAIEKLLDEAHITANKNTIPNDPKSPFVTSGIRLGTPSVTSRGMNHRGYGSRSQKQFPSLLKKAKKALQKHVRS